MTGRLLPGAQEKVQGRYAQNGKRKADAFRAYFRSRINKTFSLQTSYREIKEKEESSMTPKFGA